MDPSISHSLSHKHNWILSLTMNTNKQDQNLATIALQG